MTIVIVGKCAGIFARRRHLAITGYNKKPDVFTSNVGNHFVPIQPKDFLTWPGRLWQAGPPFHIRPARNRTFTQTIDGALNSGRSSCEV